MIEYNSPEFVNLPSVKLGICPNGNLVNSLGEVISSLELMPEHFWRSLSINDLQMILHVVELDKLNNIVNSIL